MYSETGHVIYSNQFVTIRAVDANSTVQPDARKAIAESVRVSMKLLGLEGTGHLFVTAIGASGIATSEDEGGFAMYQQGVRHIMIAAGDTPDVGISRSEWIESLHVSTIHEVVHYFQDIQGRLTGSDEDEDEAEEIAHSLAKSEFGIDVLEN